MLTSKDFTCNFEWEKFGGTNTSMPLNYFFNEKNIKLDFDIYLPTIGRNLQRDHVWTSIQRSDLIESFFKGLYIPPITLIKHTTQSHEQKKEIYKVLDGKQRLTTFIMFYNNEFPLLKNGKQYFINDLSKELKSRFERMWIECRMFYEYKYVDAPDESTEFSDNNLIELFEFVNFKGTPQDENHLNELKKYAKYLSALP